MKAPARLGLLPQLLAGFVASAAFVGALLVAGDRMLDESSQRLVNTLELQVRPLARMHSLQHQFGALRNRELELIRLADVFVVQSVAAHMREQIAALDGELTDFTTQLAGQNPVQARFLLGHWHDYRDRLGTQLRLADALDLAGMQAITDAGTHAPHLAIRSLLDDLARQTDAAANASYRTAVEEQARQRRDFLMLVLLGGLTIFAGLAYSGRVVVRRIGVLREHAQNLAAGRLDGEIGLSRHDEIGDLAQAFETMREQVRTREAALEAANQQLERRVQERTAALETANRSLVRFSQVVEQNPVGILIARIGDRVEFANPAYSRITGQPAERLIGRPLAQVLCTADPLDAENGLRMVERNLVWELEQPNRRGADTYWERLRLAPVLDETGVATHVLLAREDITEQKQQMERITHQAHYDMLTGLPNRVLANDRLQQAISSCRRSGGRVAVMYIDLDNFKEVNDTLGHAVGDQLLCQVAERLAGAVRGDDIVARLGGDEFLIVAVGIERGEDAGGIAETVVASFTAPFNIDDREISSSPSIGIAVYPDDGTDNVVLLRNADLAMYEAKESGRNVFRYYNSEIHEQTLRRIEIGRCLRGALDRDELHVVYHPLLLAESGRVIGAEALLRWTNAELGLVSPVEFIPVAERNGLIVDIGRWVLREACATLARWRTRQPDIIVAVNVSPRQLRSAGFTAMVGDAIAEFGIPPGQLEIEITEGLLMRNQAEVRLILDELHRLGVRLSMDDFGTGYSSLSYLREFPFHTVKIDRSFVRRVADDPSHRALVIAAIRMAQALGLQTVAEGVEHSSQWKFLASQECDILQGFYFGEPVRESDFDHTWVNVTVPPPLDRKAGRAATVAEPDTPGRA